MVDVKTIYPNFLTVEDALKFDRKTAMDLQLKHLNQYRTQAGIDVGCTDVIVKAEGCYLWDVDGNKHLDFIGDVGVYCLGINNPFIIGEVQKYLATKPLTMDPLMIHQTTAAFAHNMAMLTPELTRTVICGGGGMEANETMLKMVLVASGRKKPGKKRMLTTLNSFHGKSLAAVNLGGKPKWRNWMEDLPNFSYVPFGDLEAAAEELKKGDVIAFMAETIQGEGGIHVPPDDYFPGIRKLCDETDTYMLYDEVQAGTCRTGDLWAWQYYGDKAIPDAFSFAKGISDGILPVGGVQAKDDLYMAAYGSFESCFMHTATYQDNQISGAVANAAIQFIIENDVCNVIKENGKYLKGQIEALQSKYPNVIKDVRGRGYMIGIEFGTNSKGEYYTIPVSALMANKYRVHTMFSSNDERVVRVYPNFAATKEDFAWYLDVFEKAINEIVAEMGE
ncbi:MAG: aspartate aminotransferase family protein [Bacillota bacterium]|jgi:putrescine aminotransferase